MWEQYRPILLMSTDTNILNEILAVWIRQYTLDTYNLGLNCTGPLKLGYFSIVNTTALHGPWLVEPIDVDKVGQL